MLYSVSSLPADLLPSNYSFSSLRFSQLSVLFTLLCFVGVYISSTLQESNTHITGMKIMFFLFDFKYKSTFKSLKIDVVLSFTESNRRN